MGLSRNPGDGTYRFGKGTVIVMREDPKHFVLKGGNDRKYFETIASAYESKTGKKIEIKNNFMVERGPYTIAAVMDESSSKEPLKLSGLYIDLFDKDLPAQMNNVQYFGRGPEENYIDRNHGTLVGVYKTTADKMYFNYVRPQENGHHTDTRWIALSPAKGNGLVLVADSTIGFNALRNSIEDFDSEEALPHPCQWNNFSPVKLVNGISAWSSVTSPGSLPKQC